MKLVSAIFYPEPRLILSKDSESRGQGQTKNGGLKFGYP